ncbi:MAG TPA: c-type cytochrome domain-containing protein, partial [Luteolibacter sp.]|nr:c-type cytochrome domain-containing protein [Luteolibacter sp.]
MRLSSSISLTLFAALPAAAGEIEFNRDIRPILTNHCTACHGGVKQAGEISFVIRDMALAKGKSGRPAIVPGKPEASELIARVTSTDPDEVMPKPEHGPPLPPTDIEKLRQWIAQGAKWQ